MIRKSLFILFPLCIVALSVSAQSKDQQIKDLKTQLATCQEQLKSAKKQSEEQRIIAQKNEEYAIQKAEEAKRQEQMAKESIQRAEMNAKEANRQEELARSQGKLQHLVVFKFKPNTPETTIKQITDGFRSLKESVPTVISLDYGTNNSPENLNRGMTHLYKVTFKNEKDRDDYLKHAEHQKFAKMVGDLDVVEEVFVFDYSPIQ